MTALARGPLICDIGGTELTAEDRERLSHPLVGGVILFSRNYVASAQLRGLTEEIRRLRTPALLICVDHEGGRIQRFRDGFTPIGTMKSLGELWDRDVAAAAAQAERTGRLIAAELFAHGVDFSFTPVLDLDYGNSAVIGDRAFHRNPSAVAHLASALCRGLRAGGMAAVGKHFPGHGFVATDSHGEIPIDERPFAALEKDDLIPFGVLVGQGVEAIMPAHVIYPAVDDVAAGYSRVLLGGILRKRLHFDGMIFSDDLSMAGAHGAGDVVARADAATAAGCDMVLVCNDAAAVDELLRRWTPKANAELERRTAMMASRRPADLP